MALRYQLLAALVGAGIGGIIAALATGDALALIVALAVGPCVYVLAGSLLVPPEEGPPTPSTYARVLTLAVVAAGAGLSYILFGAWAAVIAVVLLIAAIVLAGLALVSGA